MEAFEDLFERKRGEVNRSQGEQGVAQEGEIGERAWVAGAGAVLAPEAVAAPVVADFHSGPMPADECLPLLRSAFGRLQGREIEPGLVGARTGLLGIDLTAHNDEAASTGKAGGIRFDGEDVEAALFNAAMPGAVLDKKGVSCRASQALACWSREGWLPLIWRR